jgi:hypothetical protein
LKLSCTFFQLIEIAGTGRGGRPRLAAIHCQPGRPVLGFPLRLFREMMNGMVPTLVHSRAKGWRVVLVVAGLAATAACDATIGDPALQSNVTPPDAAPAADASSTSRPDAAAPVDAAAPTDAAPADAAPPPPDAQPCDDGDLQTFDPGSGHCYMLFQTADDWTSSQGLCSIVGAHLATIKDEDENTLVHELAAGEVDVWLGGTDQEVEDDWHWITGEPMNFEGWRLDPLEPNNGNGNGPENCMIMEADSATGTWDDRDCAKTFPYVCERD